MLITTAGDKPILELVCNRYRHTASPKTPVPHEMLDHKVGRKIPTHTHVLKFGREKARTLIFGEKSLLVAVASQILGAKTEESSENLYNPTSLPPRHRGCSWNFVHEVVALQQLEKGTHNHIG
jgi:hypothetical protein